MGTKDIILTDLYSQNCQFFLLWLKYNEFGDKILHVCIILLEVYVYFFKNFLRHLLVGVYGKLVQV